MAEGGRRSFTASSYKGSEEVVDCPCTPCAREGTDIEAVNFCKDCGEFFCLGCTKYHKKFGLTSGHNVVSKTRAGQAGQAGRGKKSPAQLPTERCPDHDDELIKMYCRDHDVVVCNTCVSMDHRSCDGIFQIPQVTGESDARQDVPRVKDELSTSLKVIKATRQRTQQLAARNDHGKAKNLKAIDDYTERLIKHVHALKKEAVNDVMRRHGETSNMLTADLTSLDETSATLENRLKSLNSKARNDSQVFVDTKLGSREATAARQLEQRLTSPGNVTSKFVVDGRVDVVLSDISSLGKVVVNKPYKAVLKGTYDVGMEEDKYDCSVCGSCELPDGKILITDYASRCIKLLDGTYKVTKSFKMSSEPYGICQTGPSEIAVTLTVERKVQFVDVSGRWKVTMSFPVEDGCCGICYSRGELLVACGGHPGNEHYAPEGPGHVAIYSLSGSLLRKIQQDGHGRQIFSMPRHVTTSHNGDVIHVTDGRGGVISISRQDDVRSTFSENIKNAAGLCSVDSHNLIVCDYDTNNVVQISTDGELVGELLGEKHGLVTPQCVVYSPSNSTLIVICDDSNEIKVFKLH